MTHPIRLVVSTAFVALPACCFGAPVAPVATSPPLPSAQVSQPPPPVANPDDGPVVEVTLPAQLPSVLGTGSVDSVLTVRATRGGSRPIELAHRVERDGERLLDPACPFAGYRTPNLRVVVTEPIASIRVLANQRIGIGGILMHLSDGRVLCAYS